MNNEKRLKTILSTLRINNYCIYWDKEESLIIIEFIETKWYNFFRKFKIFKFIKLNEKGKNSGTIYGYNILG